jgi:tellurite resistance protein
MKLSRATKFEYLPIGLFGSVLGLTGLAQSWRLAHEQFHVPAIVGRCIGAMDLLTFCVLGACDLLKAVTGPATVLREFKDPAEGPFLAAFLANLLLVPGVLYAWSPTAARVMWIVGAACMICFVSVSLLRWSKGGLRIENVTPAWMLPVVGLLNVPIAAPVLGLPWVTGVLTYAVSVGLFLLIPLFTLLLYRLTFCAPLPKPARAALLMLVAPFAVGFSARVSLTGHIDDLAQGLYMLTVFSLLTLAGELRYLAQSCPFRVAWWSVSFPLAAATVAALTYERLAPSTLARWFSVLLLAVSSVVIAWLMVRTFAGVARGRLRELRPGGSSPSLWGG